MKRVAIVTEANETVASGHLMECIELADTLEDKRNDVIFVVNENMPSDFKGKIRRRFLEYPTDTIKKVEIISKILCEKLPEVLVFNFRKIENEFLLCIRQLYHGKVVCIDELGNRELTCDMIINPMIDSYYWNYPSTEANIYSGSKYLVLPRRLKAYHSRKKTIQVQINNIAVSMGGVDPFGTTLKLMEWLPKILPSAHIDIVVGGGFKYQDELEEKYQNNTMDLHRNIDYIYELFYESDLAFCAGGNTLHELACIGTPTITIPSMPHEVRNGQWFENHGFGKCLPITHDITFSDCCESVELCSRYEQRESFSAKGKELVDGAGADRVEEIIHRL